MRTLKITLEHLPSSTLNPNARKHWAEVACATSDAREEAGWLAKEQWHDDKPMMHAMISYEFTVRVDRARDEDNLIAACKPFQDGLIDAGVIFFDDAKHLKLGSVTINKGDRDSMTITIRELDGTLST